MKLTTFFILFSVGFAFAGKTYSQTKLLNLNLKNASVKEVLLAIEDQSDFSFMYSRNEIDVDRKVSINSQEQKIDKILNTLFDDTDVVYVVEDQIIVLTKADVYSESSSGQKRKTISGTVTGENGEPIPGVTVVIKGTNRGVTTDAYGNYSLRDVPNNGTLQFSFIGLKMQEILVAEKTAINVIMEVDAIHLDEVVAVGYGTMRKRDLTGSITTADIDKFRESSNVSVQQMLQGSVPGLNIGQVDVAGGQPSIQIRGRTSLSGTQSPLIVLDGVIYRGNLIDINPNDIKSVEILKDASSAAIYGSQAANGVMLISTKKGGKSEDGNAKFNYSSSYSFQSASKELIPVDAQGYIQMIKDAEIFHGSRTEASGWLEENPDYNPTQRFKTNDMISAYEEGLTTDWYDELTSENIFSTNHNLTITNGTNSLNYLFSGGYTKQQGYMLNEAYERWTGRINADNHFTDWLSVGVQSSVALSDYPDVSPGVGDRVLPPYAHGYDENGDYSQYAGGLKTNPLYKVDVIDRLSKRLNLFGNLYADVKLPFIAKGLSYRMNLSINHNNSRNYYYDPTGNNFQGNASKSYSNSSDIGFDNIVKYNRRIGKNHNIDATFLYGIEKRNADGTSANATVFINDALGYNMLEAGNAELQGVSSSAWSENSLYSMARLFYSFKDRYMFTGTVRRDGFSGFSENNKTAIFPSAALAYTISEEPFFKENISWADYLKLRFSYGSNGNRTVGRYNTLAKVGGGYILVDENGTPLYGTEITSMASPNLKWETTTGINAGIDFAFLNQRINGSVEYYNNNTYDLLYNVDIPSITRYSNFPTNLGQLHNYGIELTLKTVNVQTSDWRWETEFVFSRNRDEVVKLLGRDNDGDGIEDDLISEGIFIGEPLSVIYGYDTDGELWQLADKEAGLIPGGYDVGVYKVLDTDGEKGITPDDRTIRGYTTPSYRFAISSNLKYKNWQFKFFINSIQGGKDYYYGYDGLLDYWRSSSDAGFINPLPKEFMNDYWLPENPDAKYQILYKTGLNDGMQTGLITQRSFIRLQDVSLKYNVPARYLRKIFVDNLTVYISGKNLLTLTKWPGWDPETGTGIAKNGRPVLKSINFGLNLNF